MCCFRSLYLKQLHDIFTKYDPYLFVLLSPSSISVKLQNLKLNTMGEICCLNSIILFISHSQCHGDPSW